MNRGHDLTHRQKALLPIYFLLSLSLHKDNAEAALLIHLITLAGLVAAAALLRLPQGVLHGFAAAFTKPGLSSSKNSYNLTLLGWIHITPLVLKGISFVREKDAHALYHFCPSMKKMKTPFWSLPLDLKRRCRNLHFILKWWSNLNRRLMPISMMKWLCRRHHRRYRDRKHHLLQVLP